MCVCVCVYRPSRGRSSHTGCRGTRYGVLTVATRWAHGETGYVDLCVCVCGPCVATRWAHGEFSFTSCLYLVFRVPACVHVLTLLCGRLCLVAQVRSHAADLRVEKEEVLCLRQDTSAVWRMAVRPTRKHGVHLWHVRITQPCLLRCITVLHTPCILLSAKPCLATLSLLS